ncbi:deoxynucleoside kinase [Nannocystis pusilla]|uniref:deoxynucleoside kinase n=1 Tax=Nannocystis pusilla TaxID=889268 RepID=UPI003DA44C49
MSAARPRRFVAVAGNIGVGKSTLVTFLARQFRLTPHFEPNEQNPYLVDFYSDMPRWAFHSQVFFLAKKFRIHQELIRATQPVIGDRTIYEDAEIFAENLYRRKQMTRRDYQTYRELYEAIVQQLPPPDLMIYLKCSMRTLRKRIALRGRPEEQAIPTSYLRRLQELYDAWFSRYDLSETVTIETDKLDYLHDLVDRIDLFERIEKILKLRRDPDAALDEPLE